jgi:hypothetical protein
MTKLVTLASGRKDQVNADVHVHIYAILGWSTIFQWRTVHSELCSLWGWDLGALLDGWIELADQCIYI